MKFWWELDHEEKFKRTLGLILGFIVLIIFIPALTFIWVLGLLWGICESVYHYNRMYSDKRTIIDFNFGRTEFIVILLVILILVLFLLIGFLINHNFNNNTTIEQTSQSIQGDTEIKEVVISQPIMAAENAGSNQKDCKERAFSLSSVQRQHKDEYKASLYCEERCEDNEGVYNGINGHLGERGEYFLLQCYCWKAC